jgi:hypothetical protein
MKDEGNGNRAFALEITPSTTHKGFQAGFGEASTMIAMRSRDLLSFSLLGTILG